MEKPPFLAKMSAISGPSFISYVSEAERDIRRDQKLAEAMTKMYQRPDKDLEGRLLSGEIAIGHANKVIRYNVHDDPSRGISGTLVCTNFRLIFITAEKPAYDLIELQNRLVDEHDVLLNNIEYIFVEYPNKRKKLVPSSKVKDNIRRLELHCKDFRVAAFNFKLTVKGEEKGVIKPLLHHAYPQTANRLFAFDYKHDKDISKVCKVPLYRNQVDWENELRRCGVPKKLWRTSVMNRKFTALPTMGPCFIVPASISDSELANAADQFTGNRIPIWCWADSNGCSLIRASTLRPETEQQYYEDKLYEAVRNADSKKRPIKIINVSKLCPSCLQLQQSFNKLRGMCMPASESDFWESDSRSSASKWLQHISTLLSVAKEAAQFLRKKGHNVIVQETDGIDLSCVVTSLVQLILDPTCRTLDGFQALIQREWVVAGHPFLDRLGHLLQPTKKRKQLTSVTVDGDMTQLAPVFLLYLDCVYQMMVQFPARFEPSVTFLTVLYDATRMTAFETFLFNNERQRHKSICAQELHDQPFAVHEVDRVPSTQFLPIWAWEMQYNSSDMTLFNNPLYKMRTMQNYREYVEKSGNHDGKRQKLQTESETKVDKATLNGDVPDSVTAFVANPRDLNFVSPEEKILRAGKKKTSNKEKRTEEHRKKLEKDSPIPLKVRQKSGSLEENKKLVKSGSVGAKSGIIEESKLSKEPYKATPSGHYPKVALMPRQVSAVTLPPAIKQLERPPSRSKSDSECNDDDPEVKGQDDDDGIVLHIDDGRLKHRTRFSFRRKKKDSLENGETLNPDVSTYRIRLQDSAVQASALGSNGSIHALYPSSNLAQLRLWRQCYFRWLPWSQIYGGGPASMLQQESLLYDEIHILHTKLQMLKRQLCSQSPNFHSTHGEEDYSATSGVFFSHPSENLSTYETNSQKSSSQNSLNLLPSYFPYSPVKDLRSKSVLGTPMSNFLQGSSIFNFGRSRAKHARSPSNLSITHSIEDLSSATVTDGTSDTTSPASRSLEDLTAETQDLNIRDRTHSDVPPGRRRLQLLEPGAARPQRLTPPTSPTKENITYITSL